MANGIYYSKGVGDSTLPQQVTKTPFGNVVTSGGIYNSQMQEAKYTPLGGGWGVASWGNNNNSALSNLLGGGSAVTLAPAGTPTTAKGKAEQAYKNAIGLAQGGYESALGAVNFVNKHIASGDADLDSARRAAGGIGTAITNLNNTAISLSPFIESLRGQGNSLLSLYDQLISGNTAAGGIAGDYLSSVKDAADAALNITPDRYVSMAASDVQNSFGNAEGQMQRDMARRGVSLGSGASAVLKQQLMKSLATALSAAKTKARQQGIDAQLNALTQRAGLFKDVLTTAQGVQKQGTDNVAQAAGIVQAQGDMFQAAGSLANAQTNAFANIGGVEVNLGQLELSNNKLVQDTLSNVVSAQQALAKFYGDTMDVQTSERSYKNNGVTYTKGTKTYI